MKLSQKRTCNGCKALEDSSYAAHCQLHIPVKPLKTVGGIVVSFKPLAPCPKPKTIKDWLRVILTNHPT